MLMPDFNPETVRDAIFTIERYRVLTSLRRHGIEAPNSPLDLLAHRNGRDDRAEMMETARAIVYLCADHELYLETRASIIITD